MSDLQIRKMITKTTKERIKKIMDKFLQEKTEEITKTMNGVTKQSDLTENISGSCAEEFAEVLKCWDAIKARVRSTLNLSNISYDSWIVPLELVKVSGDEISIKHAGGSICYQVLVKRYSMTIKEAIFYVTGRSYRINFI